MGGCIDVRELADGRSGCIVGVATLRAAVDGSDQDSGLEQVEGHIQPPLVRYTGNVLPWKGEHVLLCSNCTPFDRLLLRWYILQEFIF